MLHQRALPLGEASSRDPSSLMTSRSGRSINEDRPRDIFPVESRSIQAAATAPLCICSSSPSILGPFEGERGLFECSKTLSSLRHTLLAPPGPSSRARPLPRAWNPAAAE